MKNIMFESKDSTPWSDLKWKRDILGNVDLHVCAQVFTLHQKCNNVHVSDAPQNTQHKIFIHIHVYAWILYTTFK